MRIISFVILFLSITINTFAIIPIYCPNCKEHIYDYQKDEIKIDTEIKAIDFKPIERNLIITCPKCHKDLYEMISAGDALEVSDFERLKDVPLPINGQKTDCPFCDAVFIASLFSDIF